LSAAISRARFWRDKGGRAQNSSVIDTKTFDWVERLEKNSEVIRIGDWFATQSSMACPSFFSGSLNVRLRNSLKLMRATGPEAERDLHN
jgi:hypothetical protein